MTTDPHDAPIPQDLQVYYDGAHRLIGADAMGSITFYNGLVVRLIERIAAAEKRAADAEAQVRQWQTWGIVEIAVRNPSVAEYMAHWEGRAFKAEAQVKALSRPVNDEEWERWSHEVVIPSRDFDPDERFHVLNRTNVNNLLAARLSSAKEKP